MAIYKSYASRYYDELPQSSAAPESMLQVTPPAAPAAAAPPPATAPQPAAQGACAPKQSGPPAKPRIEQHEPYPVESREHTRPLMAILTCLTDTFGTGFVRIYDKQIAPIQEPFLVQRKELKGRTPEQLRDHFALSFTPRFFCDAFIPIGEKIIYCSLTNAEGRRAQVYLARTRLELANERPLDVEGRHDLTPGSAPQEPAPPQQALSHPGDVAELGLAGLHSGPNGKYWLTTRVFAVNGPNGYLYFGLRFAQEGEADVMMQSAEALISHALNEGAGLVLYEGPDAEQPAHSYSYGQLLCYKIFGKLKPQPTLDPDLYPETVDKAVPPGTLVQQSHPSMNILPQYARDALSRYVKSIVGPQCELDFALISYPEIDTLLRIRLLFKSASPTKEQRMKIGSFASWCLPYAIFL
jgi:hypothetical protein